MTSPPLPPSPPSGPPWATYFSRRKLVAPWPPSPPLTTIRAPSRNNDRTSSPNIKGASRPGKRPSSPCTRRPASARLCGGRFRVHAHPLAPATVTFEGDVSVNFCVQRMVFAHANVDARVHLRAPLAHDDAARGDFLTAETLDAQPLAAAVPSVTGAADRKSTRLNSSHVAISYAV